MLRPCEAEAIVQSETVSFRVDNSADSALAISPLYVHCYSTDFLGSDAGLVIMRDCRKL
jgi:hypothetical protein